MQKIKASELTGVALDWAVAISHYTDGRNIVVYPTYITVENYPKAGGFFRFSPSSDWSQGGPIIEREKINSVYRAGDYWLAYTHDGAEFEGCGPTPLIAAMRCYVASKLGDKVEITEELL